MSIFVELNHPISDGMAAYPGMPAPRVGALLDHDASRARYSGKAEFHLGLYELAGNTGTYIDSPFHRHRDGLDLSEVPLHRLAGVPGLVLRPTLRTERAIVLDDTRPESLRGRAVLVQTGWDRRWGTQAYWEPGPFLSAESVDVLVRAEPALVGVDFWNVDDTGDPVRPAHTRLLGAGIPIVEHLCHLDALPAEGFRFYALPLRLVGGSSFPVRAVAELA
jgi:arylformamidase